MRRRKDSGNRAAPEILAVSDIWIMTFNTVAHCNVQREQAKSLTFPVTFMAFRAMRKRDEEPRLVVQSLDQLPNRGERVIVVSKSFRCLGFLDKEGVWRDAARREPVVEVTGWIPLK